MRGASGHRAHNLKTVVRRDLGVRVPRPPPSGCPLWPATCSFSRVHYPLKSHTHALPHPIVDQAFGYIPNYRVSSRRGRA
jgi:hypothetical protein